MVALLSRLNVLMAYLEVAENYVTPVVNVN